MSEKFLGKINFIAGMFEIASSLAFIFFLKPQLEVSPLYPDTLLGIILGIITLVVGLELLKSSKLKNLGVITLLLFVLFIAVLLPRMLMWLFLPTNNFVQ